MLNINKTKISATCVYKMFEVKMKIVQEQRQQLKMKFLLGYNMKVFIQKGDKKLMAGIFPGGREWTNFQLVGGLPTIPSAEKTVHP